MSLNFSQILDLIKTSLEKQPVRFVFAESCTCGLMAARIGLIPGISQYFCGSLVTYREDSKQQWLKVEPETLAQYSAVSFETSDSMALNALKQTPEAEWAFSITGHLGPTHAPDVIELDGVCFVAAAKVDQDGPCVVDRKSIRLSSETRADRQEEATQKTLVWVCETMFSK